MKYILISLLALQLSACATSKVAQELSTVGFDDKVDPDNLHTLGSIEGSDCTWYLFGWGIGPHPTVRTAFLNTVKQKQDNMIPGQEAQYSGAPLKVVKNVSVESSGFNAYIASRRCITVAGLGFN
jgi:hypothetical protein